MQKDINKNKDQTGGRERRKVERIDCKDVWLTYETPLRSLFPGDQKKRKPFPVKDLSRTGLAFLSKEKIKEGKNITMKVMLGPRQPIVTVKGEVRRLSEGSGRYPFRIGVGFTDVSNETWKRLCDIHNNVKKKDESWQEWRLKSKDGEGRTRSTTYVDSVAEAFAPKKKKDGDESVKKDGSADN